MSQARTDLIARITTAATTIVGFGCDLSNEGVLNQLAEYPARFGIETLERIAADTEANARILTELFAAHA